MESESQSNDEVESKQEHIKQRLKEMGVSDDSERPKKSFLSQYGKYFFLVIIGVLVVAYWFEYSKQDDLTNTQVADNNTASNQGQWNQPYGYPQQHQMQANNYQPPPARAWGYPPVAPQGETEQENAGNNEPAQQKSHPYYASQYPGYPGPYWGGYPGYYPPMPPSGYGYRQTPNLAPENTNVPSYPVPYGGQPYYYGWQGY